MRKSYVDYIKAIGIFLVIIGHINFANSHLGIKEWVYAFHMPLFFFATGLVIREARLDTGFLQKKINVLLIPYFLWGLIYSQLSIKNILFIGYGSYDTLTRANTLTSLWFLPAMFFGVLIVQALFAVIKKDYQRVIAMCLLGAVGALLPFIGVGYPLCIDTALLAAAFILFGHYFEMLVSDKPHWLAGVFAVVGAVGTLLYSFNNVKQAEYVLLAKRYLGNPALFFVVSIMGCIMIYGIARLIDSGNTNKVLSFIGKNTLGIFAVHKVIIKLCEKFFLHLSCAWYIELLASALVTLVASCLIVMLINKFVPILNGRKESR